MTRRRKDPISVDEACKRLGLTTPDGKPDKRAIRRLMSDRVLPFIKLSERRTVFDVDAIDRFIESHSVSELS